MKKIAAFFLLAFLLFGFSAFAEAPSLALISQEAREFVSEADLIELVCLMSRWKTGGFVSEIEALEEVLIPSLNEFESPGFFESAAGNSEISFYKKEAETKLEEICLSKTYKETEARVLDFLSFVDSIKVFFGDLREEIKSGMLRTGEELKIKIKAGIDQFIIKKQQEREEILQSYANNLAMEKTAALEQEMAQMKFTSEKQAAAYAAFRAGEIKREIDAAIALGVERAKDEMAKEINGKIFDIAGAEPEKLKALGEKMARIEEEINLAKNKNMKKYDEWRRKSAAKQGEIIMAVVEANFSDAEEKIKEKAGFLQEAKINNPEVKTAEEYVAELQKDKLALAKEIESAALNNDEQMLFSAVEEIKGKWSNLRRNLEADSAKRKSAKEVCELAIGEIKNAKPQAEKALAEIKEAEEKIKEQSASCQSFIREPLCEKVSKILSGLSSAKQDIAVLLQKINSAEEKCSLARESDAAAGYIDILLSLKYLGFEIEKKLVELRNEWAGEKDKIGAFFKRQD